MYVYLHDLVICYQNNRIADGHQKFLEAVYFLVWKGLVQKNNKFCTVSKFNIRFCLRGNLRYRRCRGSFLKCSVVDFFAKVAVKCAAEYLKESLSTGVYYACLFQNRKHLRGTRKGLLCVLKNGAEEKLQVCGFLCDLSCLYSSLTGYGKNSSFLRLHNCFVCSLHSLLHSCSDHHCIHLFMSLGSLGKASKKLGKDNA